MGDGGRRDFSAVQDSRDAPGAKLITATEVPDAYAARVVLGADSSIAAGPLERLEGGNVERLSPEGPRDRNGSFRPGNIGDILEVPAEKEDRLHRRYCTTGEGGEGLLRGC